MKLQQNLRLRVGRKTLVLFPLSGLYGPVSRNPRNFSCKFIKTEVKSHSTDVWNVKHCIGTEMQRVNTKWASLFSKSGDEWHIWFPRCRVDPAVRGLFLDSHPLSPLLTYRTYRNGSGDTQQGQSRSTRTPKCRQCKQITLGFLNGTCHFLFKKCCSLCLNGTV